MQNNSTIPLSMEIIDNIDQRDIVNVDTVSDASDYDYFEKYNNVKDITSEEEDNHEKAYKNEKINNSDSNREYRKIQDHMAEAIPRLYSTLTFIKYKSSVLRFMYKFSSILIIILSSVITFIEALRANIDTSPNQDIVITMITLTLSFIIALTASVVKFFNLQDKIERLNILSNMLETPYLEASKLYEKNNLKLEKDITHRSVAKLRKSWEKLIDQYAKPHIDAHNILHPNKVSQYMQKYNTQKKQIDDINLYNENMKSIRDIETYIVNLQKQLLKSLQNEKDFSVEDTLEKVEQLNGTLEVLNEHLKNFKSTMSKIYSRDRLQDYKTEIQNIEWWRFKNIKEKFCFCKKSEDRDDYKVNIKCEPPIYR